VYHLLLKIEPILHNYHVFGFVFICYLYCFYSCLADSRLLWANIWWLIPASPANRLSSAHVFKCFHVFVFLGKSDRHTSIYAHHGSKETWPWAGVEAGLPGQSAMGRLGPTSEFLFSAVSVQVRGTKHAPWYNSNALWAQFRELKRVPSEINSLASCFSWCSPTSPRT
jgi:hypothetical protein